MKDSEKALMIVVSYFTGLLLGYFIGYFHS